MWVGPNVAGTNELARRWVCILNCIRIYILYIPATFLYIFPSPTSFFELFQHLHLPRVSNPFPVSILTLLSSSCYLHRLYFFSDVWHSKHVSNLKEGSRKFCEPYYKERPIQVSLFTPLLHPRTNLANRLPRFYRLSMRGKTLVAKRTDLQAKVLMIRAEILEFRAFLERKSVPAEAKMLRVAAMWQRKVLAKLVRNMRLHRNALVMRVRFAWSRR